MQTQDLYQQAMKFAAEKHWQQQVPGLQANYVLHLSNVAMELFVAYQQAGDFDLAFAVRLACLHDVLEDTDTTYEELVGLFGEKVATGVLALTKNSLLPGKREQMLDSLERIMNREKEVALVKIADRITNLQPAPAHWSPEKRRDYVNEAYLIAERLANKHGYLIHRLLYKIEAYENDIRQDLLASR